MKTDKLALCLVTHSNNIPIADYLIFIEQALKGGVTLVQLREKNKPIAVLHDFAWQLKALTQRFNVPLIINDHVELAKTIDADGVHLGQTDMPVQEARALLGPSKMIGLSIETHQQLKTANRLPLDYVAASAIFSSKTKKDCQTYWGIQGLKELSKKSLHPVLAIGGITLANVAATITCGVQGVAIVNALHHTSDVEQTARAFVSLINAQSHLGSTAGSKK